MSNIIKGKSKEIFSLMDNLFDDGKNVWVVVSGMSMYPFLREDIDRVELTRRDFSSIKRGDIVLIQRTSGEFVLHRVLKKNKFDFYIIGDAQQWIEGPILKNQLKAVAININRNGKMISCNNFLLKILIKFWLIVRPIRYKLIRIFRFFHRLSL